jgi:hypothetical protein
MLSQLRQEIDLDRRTNDHIKPVDLCVEFSPDLIQVALRGFDLAFVFDSNIEHGGETNRSGVREGDSRFLTIPFILDDLPFHEVIF